MSWVFVWLIVWLVKEGEGGVGERGRVVEERKEGWNEGRKEGGFWCEWEKRVNKDEDEDENEDEGDGCLSKGEERVSTNVLGFCI